MDGLGATGLASALAVLGPSVITKRALHTHIVAAGLALATVSLACAAGCAGKISAESVREKYSQGARDPAGDERPNSLPSSPNDPATAEGKRD